MFVLFASGNTSEVGCSDSIINQLLQLTKLYSGGCGAVMVFTASLKTTDTITMYIKNAGGSGISRRYYVYKIM